MNATVNASNKVSIGAGASGSTRLLRGGLYVLLAEALAVPTALLTAGYLTRRVGAEAYGQFILVSAVVIWVEWTLTSLFARASIRFVSDAEEWRPVAARIVQLHLVTGLVGAAGLVALAPPLAWLLREPALEPLLRLHALDLPLFLLAQAHRHVLVGLGSFGVRAAIAAVRWTVRLALVVGLVESGLGIAGAVLATVGASAVELALDRVAVRPPLRGSGGFPLARFLGEAGTLFVGSVTTRLHERLDLFLVAALTSTVQAGIYGAAQSLSQVVSIAGLSFNPLTLASVTSALRAQDREQAGRLVRNALRVMLCLLLGAALIAGSSEALLALVFGDEFQSGGPVLSLLIFAVVGMQLVSMTSAVLAASGRARQSVALTLPVLPLALAGHGLLIPAMGPAGAALVTLATAWLAVGTTLIAVRSLPGSVPHLASWLRYAALCVVGFAVSALWPATGAGVALKLAVLTAAMGLALIALGELSPAERAGLKGWARGALGLRERRPA